MTSSAPHPLVHIDYRRPPDRREVFVQRLVQDRPDVKVTLAEKVPYDPPMVIHGQIVLEKGSDAVWFTFPGLWHDIGRFHRADDTFTGIYANILTPPILGSGGLWETTDLFLDIWVDTDGRLTVLDQEQFLEAEARGWVPPDQAERARAEVDWIRREFKAGKWPPKIVDEWTLQRARKGISGP